VVERLGNDGRAAATGGGYIARCAKSRSLTPVRKRRERVRDDN